MVGGVWGWRWAFLLLRNGFVRKEGGSNLCGSPSPSSWAIPTHFGARHLVATTSMGSAPSGVRRPSPHTQGLWGGLACSSSVVLASPTVQEQFIVMLGTERKDTRLRLSHNSCACNIINTSTPGMTHHPGLPSTRRHTSQINQHPSRALQTEWSNDLFGKTATLCFRTRIARYTSTWACHK